MRVEEFYGFMRKREAIRLARAAGRPAPWTEDPILRRFKFTNVKREHDRTSRLLREEFYTPHKDDAPVIILLNCAIARYFGRIETMRAIGWQRRWEPERIKKKACELEHRGEKVFTGAYVITNAGVAGNKIDVVVDLFLTDLWNQRIEIMGAAGGMQWQSFVERLQDVYGFGGTGFMSKEVALDTFYTGFWGAGVPRDRNTWTPVGPGSMRGAARVVSEKDKLNKNDTLEICRILFAERKKHWRGVELELTDTQWCLCEFDKYERVRLGEGRPRSLYNGG